MIAWFFAVAACAQTPLAPGLEPVWDMAVILQEIGNETARLLPLLDLENVPGWISQGASDTYVAQLQSCKDQARAISIEAGALSKNPEKLSAGLQLFLRFDGLDTMLSSLEEATRKYQNPDLAQKMASTYAEGSANRGRFRSYLIRLATEREHQFEVMDQETQRCRAALMAQPPAKPTVKKK